MRRSCLTLLLVFCSAHVFAQSSTSTLISDDVQQLVFHYVDLCAVKASVQVELGPEGALKFSISSAFLDYNDRIVGADPLIHPYIKEYCADEMRRFWDWSGEAVGFAKVTVQEHGLNLVRFKGKIEVGPLTGKVISGVIGPDVDQRRANDGGYLFCLDRVTQDPPKKNSMVIGNCITARFQN